MNSFSLLAQKFLHPDLLPPGNPVAQYEEL